MFYNLINLMLLREKKIFVCHDEYVVKCTHTDSNSKLKLTLDVFKEVILINPFISQLICILCLRAYINTTAASYMRTNNFF